MNRKPTKPRPRSGAVVEKPLADQRELRKRLDQNARSVLRRCVHDLANTISALRLRIGLLTQVSNVSAAQAENIAAIARMIVEAETLAGRLHTLLGTLPGRSPRGSAARPALAPSDGKAPRRK